MEINGSFKRMAIIMTHRSHVLLLLLVCLSIFFRGDSFLQPFNVNRAIFQRKLLTRMVTPLHKVTLNHAGKDHILQVAEDETILDASLDAGIELPYDCKCGVCLQCPSKIISGKVDQEGSTLDDSVMADGYSLTCMCYPRSDLVINTIEEEELVKVQFGDIS